jgi:hypothetical protein
MTNAQAGDQTVHYGDVTISAGNGAPVGYHFSELWDLTSCDMTIRFTYDANGLVDDFGRDAHAYAQLGVRTVGFDDFNPSHHGIWFATDHDDAVNTFDPDGTLDRDDKMILQHVINRGEGDYNLPATPPAPSGSYRIWFDRDGIESEPVEPPFAVNGGTYNTDGTYNVVLRLAAIGPGEGAAYLNINGLDQGFEVDGDRTTMELTPAGMTFGGDIAHLQLFYGIYGFGATHTVSFRDITVQGCQNNRFVNGGGWTWSAEGAYRLSNAAGKANFGIVARHDKNGVPQGHTTFNFRAADLNFHSSAYDRLQARAGWAEITGRGTINGQNAPTGNPYWFRVWVQDGQPDTFRIRILYGAGGDEVLVYDSGGHVPTPIGGGNITVHEK